MSTNGQEIESKFYVRNLDAIKGRLEALGAVCSIPRGFEYNLRFDDAQDSLGRQGKVLRLRQSDDVRITYKGPGERRGTSVARAEIELIVNDFNAAQQIIENLGYQIASIYEKYRAMYTYEGTIVTLDELPYGNFVEIEGEGSKAIDALAAKLGLRPAAAIPISYLGLFEQLKTVKGLAAKNLTFSDFSGVQASPADLGYSPADD